MDIYAANGTINAVAVSPGTTALALLASTLNRARVHWFSLNVGGTPVADNIPTWLIRRITGPGTSTAVVPALLDLGGPASQLTAGQNHTVEPTFGATLLGMALHQRSLYQWNASPGGEIVLPATAGAGLGITPFHASYTGSAQSSLMWRE